MSQKEKAKGSSCLKETNLISEIGDISSFDHERKLVAFAGIDPSVFSSGKFSATKNRITKRGSTHLRRVLDLAVLCGIRGAVKNKRIRTFYDKKRLEGKPHRVALACTNKLLHIILALLKKSACLLLPLLILKKVNIYITPVGAGGTHRVLILP